MKVQSIIIFFFFLWIFFSLKLMLIFLKIFLIQSFPHLLLFLWNYYNIFTKMYFIWLTILCAFQYFNATTNLGIFFKNNFFRDFYSFNQGYLLSKEKAILMKARSRSFYKQEHRSDAFVDSIFLLISWTLRVNDLRVDSLEIFIKISLNPFSDKSHYEIFNFKLLS